MDFPFSNYIDISAGSGAFSGGLALRGLGNTFWHPPMMPQDDNSLHIVATPVVSMLAVTTPVVAIHAVATPAVAKPAVVTPIVVMPVMAMPTSLDCGFRN